MISGKDRDALIAEKIMGWILDPEGCWLDKNDNYASTGWGDAHNTYGLPVWSPYTDIVAAREVLDKIL